MIARKYIVFILPVLILLSLSSCMNVRQPNLDMNYYTLEYDVPEYSEKEQLPFIIKIEPFKVAPVYDTTSIIYRRKAYELNSYSYHKWSVNPSDIVTYLAGRDLKKSGLFKGVLLPGDRNREISFRLSGMIDEFYELDGESEWSGVLKVSITLIPESREKRRGFDIFQKTYRTIEKCEKKNPASLAEAMSRAMKKVSLQIGEDIYGFIGEGEGS